jgi:hypothetical protein
VPKPKKPTQALPLEKIWNELSEKRSWRLLLDAGAIRWEALEYADTSWRGLPVRLRALIRGTLNARA